MVKLYHYTNQSGLEGIKKNREIISSKLGQNSSKQKDTAFGSGVYLTSLNPEKYNKGKIASNNYGNYGKSKRQGGYVDFYVQIEIPVGHPKLSKCDSNRDIYLFHDNIDLKDFKWSSGKNSEWGVGEIVAAASLGVLAVGGAVALGKYVYDNWDTKPKQQMSKKQGRQNDGDSDDSGDDDGCTQQ